MVDAGEGGLNVLVHYSLRIWDICWECNFLVCLITSVMHTIILSFIILGSYRLGNFLNTCSIFAEDKHMLCMVFKCKPKLREIPDLLFYHYSSWEKLPLFWKRNITSDVLSATDVTQLLKKRETFYGVRSCQLQLIVTLDEGCRSFWDR